MNEKKDTNEKELLFLKEKLGIDNPSPNQLKQALKELVSRKVISNFHVKKEKE